MLIKENRLTTKFQFNVVRKYGIKYLSEFFTLTILKTRNYEGPVQIGFVVPNVIHKKATKRNRIKRLLREAFRGRIDKLPINHWVVVSVKPKILDKSYEEICDQVDRTIQKIPVSN